MSGYCKMCLVCDGRGCKNTIPGPGAKGVGDTAIRNYSEWKKIRVNMDTFTENKDVNSNVNLFGKNFSAPIFAGPVGAVSLHYGDKYDDLQYNQMVIQACKEKGIAAFTGDGLDYQVMISATEAIQSCDGYGVPTVKPWNRDTIEEKMELVRKSGSFAVAMDIDAAGLPFLKNMEPPAGGKSVSEMKEIISSIDKPFILKGIMTPKGALKAKQAGASAIVVSNHGGRVLDQCPSTAEVLESIVEAVGKSMTILVDGGIRSGVDVFKALAIGADGVLICRPFVTAAYKDGIDGIRQYIDKIIDELQDTMQMCGAYSLDEIDKSMIFK